MMQGVKNAQTIDEGYKAYHRQRDEFKKQKIKEFHEKQVLYGHTQLNFANFGYQNYRVLSDSQFEYISNAIYHPNELAKPIEIAY